MPWSFVEGPTLEEMIAASIPLHDALGIARQIAAALDAAHEAGIVHRDLKPANVKIRHDGTVKVLDFGLAKAIVGTDDRSSSANLANSPTVTTPAATAMGMILGTAAYMSPEQARGRPVDKRADIWAFGAVLYELLTGQKAFAGDTVTDIIAAVVTREPDLAALPATTPAAVRQLLRRCLEKDSKRRLRDVSEAGLVLTDAMADPDASVGPAAAVPAATARASSRRGLVALAIVLGVALVVSLSLLLQATRPGDPAPLRFDIQAPPGTAFRTENRPMVAISPDGTTFALAVFGDGVSRLYVRRRDESEARLIAGTDGASDPVFSPDGRWIAFAANGELKKASIDGPVEALARVAESRSATWLDQSTIVYAPGPDTGLFAIDAGGGTPRSVTELDAARGERTHRWPTALPGGSTVLFTVGSLASPDDYDSASIDAVILDTGDRRTLVEGASFVRYSPTGHLLFARGGSVYAVPFDPDTLVVSGNPVPVVQGVAGDSTTGAAHFAVAEDGTFIYVAGTGTNRDRQIFWVAPTGPPQPLTNLPPAFYNDPSISPDGRQAAFIMGSSGSGDVWVYDFDRMTPTRLTFDGTNATPAWSPDSRFIYYASVDPAAGTKLFRKRADGSAEAEAVGTLASTRVFVDHVDPLGRSFIVTAYNAGRYDIITAGADSTDRGPVLASTAGNASVSPDGRWMAYYTDASGREEVFVRDLEPSGGRWQVSTNGGTEPHWSTDGRELYFRSDTQLLAVPVQSDEQFRNGQPRVLLDNIFNLRSDTMKSYDVDPNGGRFLMIRPADARATDAITGFRVVLNWFAEVRAKLD